MPTWPTTKAGTTHLDAGSDNPGSARADIKQNVDNVNDMIDTIVVNSPTANQILAYDTGDSRFENVDIDSIVSDAGVSAVAVVSNATSSKAWTSSYVTVDGFTETHDPDGILSIDVAGDTITLAAGTYLIMFDTISNSFSTGSSERTLNWQLYDTTNTATVKEGESANARQSSGPVYHEMFLDRQTVVTFGTSVDLEFQIKAGGSMTISNSFPIRQITFMKV